jgi:S-(hydroxymethyl)glutathione dehydrogenase/alcohol dehydrogenase
MIFKAAILEKLNAPLAVKEVYTTELQVGQVLVRVLASGLCGAQLHEIKGHKGNAKFLPHLMGHEGCGIVEEISPGVTTVSPGDKVVMHWRKSSGIEAPFPKYILDGKEMSSGKVTTLSEYSVVSENRLTAVPHDTPEYLCALLGCGMTTALGIINNDANLKFGESILILGCGGVGLGLIQGAALASAYPIVCVDINEQKRERALMLGATVFVNLSKEEIDGTFDVIVDTTGKPGVVAKTMSSLSDNGRYILVGQPRPGESFVIPDGINLWTPNGKTIKVSQGGDTSPSDDIPRYIKMHNAGLLSIDKTVTHTFALSEVNEAFSLLMSGNAGRIMINTD